MVLNFEELNMDKEMKDFFNHQLLYDSCDIYVKHYINEKYKLGKLLPSCFGDENILELCNRCLYFKVETEQSQD